MHANSNMNCQFLERISNNNPYLPVMSVNNNIDILRLIRKLNQHLVYTTIKNTTAFYIIANPPVITPIKLKTKEIDKKNNGMEIAQTRKQSAAVRNLSKIKMVF